MNLGEELVAALHQPATPIVFGIVAIAALIRGLTGFGFAILAVPLLALIMPPAHAVVFAIIMQTLIGPFGVPQALLHIDKGRVWRLALFAMASTPLGVLLLTMIPQDYTRLIIAFVALGVFLIFMLKRSPDIPEGALPLAVTAVSAGVLNGFAAMPGPPVILYFVRDSVPPIVARASMITFFFFTGLAAMLACWWRGLLTQDLLLLSMVALPVMVAGNHIGARFFGRVDEPVWRAVVVALLMVSAAGATVRALG